MITPPAPRLLEVSHVAQRLGTCQEYVRRLIRLRQLEAVRLGARYRIEPAALQTFIDKRRLLGRE